jgi:phenylacetate-CoA ligase
MDERSRSVIEKCFGAGSLMEIYGAIESSIIAWQIEGEDYFNICHTTDYLEVIDGIGQDTNFGTSLLTDLFIRSFPMIRYNLGDILDTEVKNGLQVIRKIKDCQDDNIVFANGVSLPWHIFALIIERQQAIKQFRVIQEAYDKIRVQLSIEAGADKSAMENSILSDLHDEVPNKDMEYVIDFVDHIPPDPNGKIRMLISKVNQDLLISPYRPPV